MTTQRTNTDRWGETRTSGGRAAAALMLIALLLPAGASAQQATEGGAARAAQLARHQALWAMCRSCLIEVPAGPARAEAGGAAAPRRISPYASQSVAGLPAVAVVEGRVVSVTSQLTGDGRGVFTEYQLVVEGITQNSTLLPTAIGQTVMVTRPGGEATLRGQRRVVSVAGYPALESGRSVAVTLIAVPDAGSYQEVSLRPRAGRKP